MPMEIGILVTGGKVAAVGAMGAMKISANEKVQTEYDLTTT